MSAVAGNVTRLRPQSAPAHPRLVLLGTGTVGRAFLQRYLRLATQLELPRLALIANSRDARTCGLDAGPALAFDNVQRSTRERNTVRIDDAVLRRGDIVIDATASDAVARQHAEWLQRGLHVVTANKLGAGASQVRADAITTAQAQGESRYGDAATVGAGLPVLRSIRELVRGGDRILSIQGVLSGSLAWLFHQFDGVRGFSEFVREAREAGYTEPDPRIDLSGEDVRRKLLILARAAGIPLEASAVHVESLVPGLLAGADASQLDALLPVLDAPLRERHAQTRRVATKLCFVGELQVDEAGIAQANVGLRALPAGHPLLAGSETDNRVVIRSCRYDAQPLVIQGPGAGAEVTAAALLDDVLSISRQAFG